MARNTCGVTQNKQVWSKKVLLTAEENTMETGLGFVPQMGLALKAETRPSLSAHSESPSKRHVLDGEGPIEAKPTPSSHFGPLSFPGALLCFPEKALPVLPIL